MTLLKDKKERAIVMACAYLAVLFLASIAMWWTVFIGGNPITFKSIKMLDDHGEQVTELRVGDVVGIHRSLCSTEAIGVQFFPSLHDSQDKMFTMPPGVYDLENGCTEKAYGFVVPNIPPGEYTYHSIFRFQSSLVGRDETAASPIVKVRIVK